MYGLIGLLLSSVVSPAAAAQPARVIPFELRNSRPFLMVRVNGSQPLPFELDTFAGLDCIARRAALAMKLPFQEQGIQRNAGAGDGTTRVAMARNVQLDVFGWPLTASQFAVLDLDGVAERQGVRFDGLIGGRQLLPYVVELDAPAGVIRLYNPAGWSYTGDGVVLPMRLVNGFAPAVRAALLLDGGDPVEGEFVFDSPAGGILTAAAPFVRKNNLLARAGKSGKLHPDEVVGVGGASRKWIARIAGIRLGSYVLKQPIVNLTDAQGGAFAREDIAGILEGELLRRFRVILDYPGKRMILEPGTLAQEPFEADMSGIRWILAAPDFNEFHVRAVVEDSPAAQAGVRAGDVLLLVNGKPASQFDRAALRTALQGPGRKLVLTLRRGTERVECRFSLRRLL